MVKLTKTDRNIVRILSIFLAIFIFLSITVWYYPKISPGQTTAIDGIVTTSITYPTISLNSVRAAAIYEPIDAPMGKGGYLTNLSAANLLSNAKIDFILRGYFKWGHCPEWWPWTLSLLGGNPLPCTYQGQLRSLDELSNEIKQLKQQNSNLIVGGAISFSHVDPEDTYANGTPIENDWTQMMLRDKNGNPIPFYNGYVSDIASPMWREYLIGWTEKQIDAGVDCFFFDQHMMAAQYKVVQGADLLSTINEYEGYFKQIVNEVRSYAASKGRTICISFNSNGNAIEKRGEMQNGTKVLQIMYDGMDYVIASTSVHDFNTTPPTLMEDWPGVKSALALAGINLPIVTFLDWSGQCNWCQLYGLAHLSKQNQINYLTAVDADTKANGIIFAYPIWGGADQMYLDRYDSVRAGTYNTIVQLANSQPFQTTTTTSTSTSTTTTITGGTHPPITAPMVIALVGPAIVIIIAWLWNRMRMKRNKKSKK